MLAMFAGAEVVHRYYRPDLVSARRALLALLRPVACVPDGGSPVEVLGRKVSGRLERNR